MKDRSTKSHFWNRLTFSVTAVVLATLFLALAFIYVYMSKSLSDVTSKSAEEKVALLAKQNAQVVKEYLETMSSYSKSLAMFMEQLVGSDIDQATVSETIEKTLESFFDDERIFGAYVAWEPNLAIPNTPEGLSYYAYRDNGRISIEVENDYDTYSTKDYYTVSRDTRKPYVAEPYSEEMTNGETVWLLTVSYPIIDAKDTLVGVVNFDVVANEIDTLAYNVGGYKTAYTCTLTNSGTFLSHSKLPERVGTAYGAEETDAQSGAVLPAVMNGQELALNAASGVTGNTAYILFTPIKTGGIDQTFSSAFVVDASEVMAERDKLMNTLLLIIVIVAVVIYAATFFNIYRMVSPVRKILNAAESLEKGELAITDNVKVKNEFGMIFNAIGGVRNTLKELEADTRSLTDAALVGSLSYRADPDKHQGAYKAIIEGFNGTLDAVIAPVQEASGVLVELSKGNLDTAMQGHYKGDHNIIKHALNDTIEALRSYLGELSEHLGAMAGGDFSVSIKREYKGDFIRIKDSVNTIAESMSAVLADIRSAADQVSAGTLQVSSGSQAISQGATEQAAAIEQLTASIAEIAAQTRENALGANKASELSASARIKALEGRERMAMLQGAMTEINEASESIYKIIKVIDDIAFQTNILALNAAVEAARAGVHGKGFGVVAEEVRALAGKSKDAASETAALIEGSVKKTETGNKIADQTAAELDGIVEQVESAAKLVGDIAVASSDQATAISQVNKGIEQMSQVVQTNSATAEEQAATSEELSGQAEMLKNQVGEFRLG